LAIRDLLKEASAEAAAGPDPARSPLGHLSGKRPAAPAWFEHALAQAPERSTLVVEGAELEMLAWGRRGDPGLLLLHGFAAHADWWSFIAPFLAEGRRVVASSWSGMGGSQWRHAYSMEQHAREALAVAEAGGLFESDQAPIIIGHSYGSFIARLVGQTAGERLGGLVLVDGPLSPERREGLPTRLGHGTHRVYPTLEGALARFRFTPVQTCEHLFIADHIARGSLKAEAEGEAGWTWRFDGNLTGKSVFVGAERLIAPTLCPQALVFGDRSKLMTPERLEFLRLNTAADAPWIDIPDAGHHIMVDQPLALVAGLRGLLAAWPPKP